MIFLDNASTTKINDDALNIYIEESKNNYFNPSALYMKGANIQKRINKEKQKILEYLNASKFDNIIFTSGATESNNMVLRSFIKPSKKALIGISEHPSVFNVAKSMLDNGYDIIFINLNEDGTINIDDFESKLTKDVNFVSIMHVNNETGAINPIQELVQKAKKVNPSITFHCDGVQAFGKIEVDLETLNVDLYTLSSHKIYGPKGIGALYVRKGVNIKPLLLGGGQENELRSGTENTPAIFAFTKACEFVYNNQKENLNRIYKIKEYLVDRLNEIPYDIKIISNDKCSPYIISFAVANLRAETVLRILENNEVLVGNGSACSSKKRSNRILTAMKVSDNYIEGALRISLSYATNLSEIDSFINKFTDAISEYKQNTNR